MGCTISSCRPFALPSWEKANSAISKTWDAFCHFIDIPEYPVQGDLWGNHWKEIKSKQVVKEFETKIIRDADRAWHDVFDSIAKLQGANQYNFQLNALRAYPLDASSCEAIIEFEVIEQEDADIEAIVQGIRDLDGIREFETGQGKERIIEEHLYLDTSTGIAYNGKGKYHNSKMWLRLKGFALIFGIPIYALGCIAYNLLKIIPTIAYLTFEIFYIYNNQEQQEEKITFKAIVWLKLKEMGYETWVALRSIAFTPFFTMGMEAGAFCAIFSPLNGMKIIGSFEYFFNHRRDRYQATCFSLCKKLKFSTKSLFVNGTYYFVFCMSPAGIVKVDHEKNILDEKLYKMPQDLTNFSWRELTEYRPFSILKN